MPLLCILLVPSAEAAPLAVKVEVHAISFGNYDTNRGTYTLDFYLHLSHDARAAVGVDEFEFMNGRAASSKLLSDTTDNATGVRDVWYRIQANLYSQPRFDDFPFDRQSVRLEMEDAVHASDQIVYRVTGQPTVDLSIAGWRIDGADATVTDHPYSFNETYSRYVYTIHVSREPLSAGLRSFLPPLAFMVVSGLSFLLHPSKVAQRITLGTSMLISGVGFHVSQTVALPTLGKLTLFDQVMLAAYAFLAASLVVTTVIAHNEDFRKDPGRSARANRMGAYASIALPFVVFLLLRAL